MIFLANKFVVTIHYFTCSIDNIRIISGDKLVLNFDSMTEVVPTVKSEYYIHHDEKNLNYTLFKFDLKLFEPHIDSFTLFCSLLYVSVITIYAGILIYSQYSSYLVEWKYVRLAHDLLYVYTWFVLSCIFRYCHIYLSLYDSIYNVCYFLELFSHFLVYLYCYGVVYNFYHIQGHIIQNTLFFNLSSFVIMTLYLIAFYKI